MLLTRSSQEYSLRGPTPPAVHSFSSSWDLNSVRNTWCNSSPERSCDCTPVHEMMLCLMCQFAPWGDLNIWRALSCWGASASMFFTSPGWHNVWIPSQLGKGKYPFPVAFFQVPSSFCWSPAAVVYIEYGGFGRLIIRTLFQFYSYSSQVPTAVLCRSPAQPPVS